MSDLLPTYRTIKHVRAGEILSVSNGVVTVSLAPVGAPTGGYPFQARHMGDAWITKHQPKAGGVFIDYPPKGTRQDYQSYCPMDVFLEDATLVDDENEPLSGHPDSISGETLGPASELGKQQASVPSSEDGRS